jgi:hypothetical protein
MLRKFCEEEKVGDGGKGYDCSKCGGGPGSVTIYSLFDHDFTTSRLHDFTTSLT